MDAKTVEKIIGRMKDYIDETQLCKLKQVLNDISYEDKKFDVDLVQKFIDSKKVEGCSHRTSEYYSQVLKYFKKNIGTRVCDVQTDEIRLYLSKYQQNNKCSNVTLDNIRRILSSFYKWLENEDFILKSPMNRIHKVKTPVIMKSIFSEEEVELLRNDFLVSRRNFAIINLLISSGIRIGELVNLNIDDINLSSQTGIVKGKGNKERQIYFDVKTKISIEKYLRTRCDNNEALFVSERCYKKTAGRRRISINHIEGLIRRSGNKLNIAKTHPHKFRRTIATRAIDKGMPIEQVQVLLGHSKVDTTLLYAQVLQRNVRASYLRYIC